MATNRARHQRPAPRAPRARPRQSKVKRHYGIRRSPQERHRSWQEFSDHARNDPKAAIEGDFKAVLAGLVIATLGSLLVGGDAYWTIWSSSPGPPVPIFGVIVFFIGGVIIVTGIVLAILCIVVNLLARVTRRSKT